MNIPSNSNATRKGEDGAKEELEALRAEARQNEPEPQPEPKSEPEGPDVKSVIQAAQIAMAASSAL